jgi:hypothetical protein
MGIFHKSVMSFSANFCFETDCTVQDDRKQEIYLCVRFLKVCTTENSLRTVSESTCLFHWSAPLFKT